MLFFRRAVALNPQAPFFHAHLAQALEDIDRWEQSLSHREIAARLQRDVPVFHYRLGLTLGILGRLEEAAQALESAVALEPLYHGAYAALGTVYRGLGRLREAVTAYERCDAICPEYLDHRPTVREAWKDAQTRLLASDPELAETPSPHPRHERQGGHQAASAPGRGRPAGRLRQDAALSRRPDQGHRGGRLRGLRRSAFGVRDERSFPVQARNREPFLAGSTERSVRGSHRSLWRRRDRASHRGR